MMVSNQKVKALLFTLILAFIAIGTITVAAVMKNEKPVEVEQVKIKADTEWFYFTSPIAPTHPQYQDALLDESNYAPANLDENETPQDCEEGNDKVCAVRAEPNPLNPDEPNPTDLANLISEMTSSNPDPNLVILKEF